MLSTSVPIAAAAEQNKASAKSNSGYYSLDDVNTDYLLPKSDDKMSQDADKVSDTKIANADDSPLTNQTDMFDYDDFGFDSSELDKNIKTVADNTAYDDPLADAEMVVPNELVLSYINKGDDHKGEINNYDEQTDLAATNKVSSLTKSSDTIKLSESKSGQTHNTIGIDYDGDGVDELVYSSLYAGDNGYISIETYERKESNGSMTNEWQRKGLAELTISSDNEILDIEAQHSKGYTSLAAGDYDNDGCEELAAYFPCANNGYGAPFIGIIDITKDGVVNFNEMERIYLKDVSEEADMNNLKKGDGSYYKYHMPVVALSTTSIRSNGSSDTTQSYDDLVINVSVPRSYTDDDDNMNSCVAVYSKQSGKYQKEFYCDLKGETTRMIYNNSVDADLNGDGYDELVVAGWYEYGLPKNNDKANGSISKNEALVQLISWNGNGYELVWENADPSNENGMKKVSFSGSLELINNKEPIALTAGHYSSNVPLTQDYICVNGSINKCEGATIYANKTATDSEGNIIPETAPFHDKTNFESTNDKKVIFESVYKVDIRNNACDATDEQFISTADSGMFLAGSTNDVIVMLVGDTVSGNSDWLNYHIVFVYCDNAGVWHETVNKEFMNNVDEDDNGTSISVCFANTDCDTTCYRYKGKSVGYSSPTLYSVVQVPPYYKEANNANSSCTISYGFSDGTRGSWGVGQTAGFTTTASVSVPGIVKGSWSLAANIGASYTGYSLAMNTVDSSITLNVPSDSDYAIVFATPVVYNYYDQWVPTDTNGNGYWGTCCSIQTLSPVFTTLSIDEYNKAASDMWHSYEQSKTNKDDDDVIEDWESLCNAAPVVENLPKSDAGNVGGYYGESEFNNYLSKTFDLQENDKNEKYGVVGVEVKDDKSSKGSQGKVSFSSKSETGHGFDIKASATQTLTLGGGIIFASASQSVSITANANGGCTWISASSNGFALSASFNPINTSNENKIYDSHSNNSYSEIEESNIVHYDADDYRYTANLVGYKTDKLNSYQKVDDVDGDDNESGIDRNEVYILSFYVTNGTSTPTELPEYFGVRDVTNNDDGTYDVTLSWKTTVNDEDRTPDAYNLYIKAIAGGSDSGQNSYYLLNKNAPIYRNNDEVIMNYTVHLTKEDLATTSSFSFFITSLKQNDKSGLSYTESAPSRIVTVNPAKVVDKHGITIVNQPSNQSFVNDGENVTFSVEAYAENGENLSYSWEKFNSKTEQWEPIKKANSSTYTCEASLETEYTPIRCAISRSTSTTSNVIVYSEIVTYYNQQLRGSVLMTGDVNANSAITIADATEIQRYIANIKEKNKDAIFVADIDKDGVIDIKDVTMLQNILAEIKT